MGTTVETLLAARTEWEPSPREGTDSNIAHDADLVIVLGGDGSILRTARWMGYQQTPVLGVNLGRLGFLADFSPNEVEMAISELIAGRFHLVEHMMFETCVERENKMVASDLGLNETSLLAGPPFSLFEVELHVDDELATIYRGDGLIISTPVGSTAYNMSAGGPIVRKSLEAFIFTPLNPHTLTQRTVIDTASRKLQFGGTISSTTAPHVLLMAAFCYHCRLGTKSEYHVRNQNSVLLKQTSMVTTPLSVTSWHGEEVFRTRHQKLTDVKCDALAQHKKRTDMKYFVFICFAGLLTCNGNLICPRQAHVPKKTFTTPPL